MKSIKLLLTSDLHLGIDKPGSINIRNERIETFRKIMAMGLQHDILLIAGDLIDRNLTEDDFFDIAAPEFENLKNNKVEIFYTPGPEELSGNPGIIDYISALENCHYFSDESPAAYMKSAKGPLFIYGVQAESRHAFTSITRNSSNGFHIGLFYSDFNPRIQGIFNDNCIDKNIIKQMNLDFYALGRSHAFKMFKSLNRIIGACPGSPEPCSIEESGDRFVISMEVENNTIRNIKRIPVNTSLIASASIDCTAIKDEMELLETIKSKKTDSGFLNIVLNGTLSFHITGKISDELKGFCRGMQIINRTAPSLDMQISSFSGENSVKGEIYRTIAAKINNMDMPGELNTHALARVLQHRFSSSGTDREVLFCDL